MASNDEPRCKHEPNNLRVTNQVGEYDSTRSHASTVVCDERPCILDAQAWVERCTGERAYVLDRAGQIVTV